MTGVSSFARPTPSPRQTGSSLSTTRRSVAEIAQGWMPSRRLARPRRAAATRSRGNWVAWTRSGANTPRRAAVRSIFHCHLAPHCRSLALCLATTRRTGRATMHGKTPCRACASSAATAARVSHVWRRRARPRRPRSTGTARARSTSMRRRRRSLHCRWTHVRTARRYTLSTLPRLSPTTLPRSAYCRPPLQGKPSLLPRSTALCHPPHRRLRAHWIHCQSPHRPQGGGLRRHPQSRRGGSRQRCQCGRGS